VIINFHTIVWTFRGLLRRSGLKPRGWRVGFPHSPATAQITLSSVKPHSPATAQITLSSVKPHSPATAQITLSSVKPHSPVTAQITLSSVKLCLLISDVDCFCALWNDTRLNGLMQLCLQKVFVS
jgi:hypothetical protein